MGSTKGTKQTNPTGADAEKPTCAHVRAQMNKNQVATKNQRSKVCKSTYLLEHARAFSLKAGVTQQIDQKQSHTRICSDPQAARWRSASARGADCLRRKPRTGDQFWECRGEDEHRAQRPRLAPRQGFEDSKSFYLIRSRIVGYQCVRRCFSAMACALKHSHPHHPPH